MANANTTPRTFTATAGTSPKPSPMSLLKSGVTVPFMLSIPDRRGTWRFHALTPVPGSSDPNLLNLRAAAGSFSEEDFLRAPRAARHVALPSGLPGAARPALRICRAALDPTAGDGCLHVVTGMHPFRRRTI